MPGRGLRPTAIRGARGSDRGRADVYLVRTDGAAWCVRTGPGVFEVQDGPADSPPEVTVSGPYEAVLRWVWNRESSPATQVSVDGSPEAVTLLERCIAVATQ